MRPDRLVVGEVRGAEVVDLLAALNTGHEGGCGTLHANRPAEVPARLEALGVAAGLDRGRGAQPGGRRRWTSCVHLRRDAGRPAGRRRSACVRARPVTWVSVDGRAGGPTAVRARPPTGLDGAAGGGTG